MAWIIADRRHSPALRSLQLSADKGATIPVGCRRMHPDFTHLDHLSITRDIFLCINFICHLLPLRCALGPCLSLGKHQSVSAGFNGPSVALREWQIFTHDRAGQYAVLQYRARSIRLVVNRPLTRWGCRTQGMACCEALVGVLDEYTQKKREGRIYVHHGVDETNQHGFMVPFGT